MANKIFTATKTVELDYAHKVPRHDSKCRNVHGHRAKLEVVVEGRLITTGSSTDMVMDFSHIKALMIEEIVARFDHCMIIAHNDHEFKRSLGLTNRLPDDMVTNVFGARYNVKGFGIIQELNAGSPTAEILAYACYMALVSKMPKGCKLQCVRFWETPNSVAEYASLSYTAKHAAANAG